MKEKRSWTKIATHSQYYRKEGYYLSETCDVFLDDEFVTLYATSMHDFFPQHLIIKFRPSVQKNDDEHLEYYTF
jgi:hypothetical protein